MPRLPRRNKNYERKIYDLLVQWANNKPRIGGRDRIVEIDESQVTKRSLSQRARWVLGGIDRISKDMFIVEINDMKKQTLLTMLRKYIEPGTTIYTDGRPLYNCLTQHGYNHRKVIHSQGFVNSDGTHTQTIEGAWADMKRKIPKIKRNTERLDYYLAEYLFKKKYAKDMKMASHQLLHLIATKYNPYENNDEIVVEPAAAAQNAQDIIVID